MPYVLRFAYIRSPIDFYNELKNESLDDSICRVSCHNYVNTWFDKGVSKNKKIYSRMYVCFGNIIRKKER